MKIEGEWDRAFDEVALTLRRQLSGFGRGGAAVCVYHRGRPVVDIWAGQSSRGTAWDQDTLSLSFSTTKGVMATLLHVLVDRGHLRHEDPVARHWPEFGQAGKGSITVRQLLSHEAGLYSIRSRIDHADRMLDWDHMVDVLAAARPAFEPGSASGYHGLTYGWLVGELIRRVTGRSLEQVLAEELVGPLGLDGLTLGCPAPERHRIATLLRPALDPEPLVTGPLLGRLASILPIPLDTGRIAEALVPKGVLPVFFSPAILDVPVPAANGVFTARSLARLYAALAGGGSLDGVRLLSAETLDAAGRVQSRRFDRVLSFPMRWRMGYHFVPSLRGIVRRAFGHFGFGGSGAFADPVRDVSVAMTLNRVAGLPVGDLRMVQIATAALRSAEAARPPTWRRAVQTDRANRIWAT